MNSKRRKVDKSKSGKVHHRNAKSRKVEKCSRVRLMVLHVSTSRRFYFSRCGDASTVRFSNCLLLYFSTFRVEVMQLLFQFVYFSTFDCSTFLLLYFCILTYNTYFSICIPFYRYSSLTFRVYHYAASFLYSGLALYCPFLLFNFLRL